MFEKETLESGVGFPDRIRQVRQALGLNQTGLSSRLGVGRSIISEFEGGSRAPSREFIVALPNIGVSVDWFLSGEGQMFLATKNDTVSQLDAVVRLHGMDTESASPDASKGAAATLLHGFPVRLGVSEALDLAEKAINIGHRVGMARKELGLGEGEFSGQLGIDVKTLRYLEKAPEIPSQFVRELVRERGVDPRWLLYGGDVPKLSGEEYRILNSGKAGGQEASVESNECLDPAAVPSAAEFSQIAFRRGKALVLQPTDADRDKAVLLPLLNQRASAGPGQAALEVQEVEDLIPVVQDLLGHNRPQDCFVLRVAGDSMAEMQINHGDLVICTRKDKWGDGVYAITHNQEVRVKRLEIRVADRKVLIISENRRYPEPEIESFDALDDGRLVIEGKLIAWLHRHMY